MHMSSEVMPVFAIAPGTYLSRMRVHDRAGTSIVSP